MATPTWNSWHCMHNRCTQPSHENYHRYGGRGIKVCERWSNFENFLADMGERPAGKTLDRFPNKDGHYEPGNCRWATPKEQKANSVWRGGAPGTLIEFRGERRTSYGWSQRLGINAGTIRTRLKAGWPVERALCASVRS